MRRGWSEVQQLASHFDDPEPLAELRPGDQGTYRPQPVRRFPSPSLTAASELEGCRP